MFGQAKYDKWLIGLALAAVLAMATASFFTGCAASGRTDSQGGQVEASADATTRPAADAQATASKGGAQLWSENCGRCHNLRPPTQYSAAEWQIIVHHMRLRADLTGQEQRSITEFLQSATH
jgi:cytochrome c5